MLEGVDVSYANGNYQPAGESFVIVNASRANIGLAVGSMYRAQLANARNAGKHVGHYFFNGNVDPTVCADYFVGNLDYHPGESLWLDCEAEPSTGTVAWGPAQAAAFNARVMAHGLPCPGVYLNRSLMDGADWSPVVAQAAPLWVAYYNPTPPPIKWWPTWTLWQYTDVPLDRDRANTDSIAALGATTLEDDLTPEQDARLKNIEAWLYNGGPDAAKGWSGQAGTILRYAHDAAVAVTQKVQRDGNEVAQIQDNADTNTMVRQLLGRPSTAAPAVDVEALAAAIIAKLPATNLTKQDVIDVLNTLVLKAS